MFTYAMMIATGVLGLGYITNESVEIVVWQSLLNSEIDDLIKHRALDPNAPLPSSSNLHAYAVERAQVDASGLPVALAALTPGLHDEVELGDREAAVMVRDAGAQRFYMVIDITALEADERALTAWLLVVTGVVTVLLAALGWWISGRLLRPLSNFTAEIDQLRPTTGGKRVSFDALAQDEIASIGRAVNGLLDRIDGLVARERIFITTASHELRTPIAAIIGAAEVAAGQSDLSEAARKPLQRIQRASRDIDQLIHVLLVLTKSPERIMESAGIFALDEVVDEVVGDHAPLTAAKSLTLRVGALAPCNIQAPIGIAQIAIANLVRNAIQHSDHGVVSVSIEPAGVVRVVDPGHGMPAEDISKLYATLARQGDGQHGRGVGLELMGRICEHLGWVLEIQADEGGGTLATLDLRCSFVGPR
ncbi:MAG: HAMP domain-containing histidine kinase [Xanthomonadales bacterium]|nr:HAMP domain-containing histidine kinase [Xanthomonadales bacterium]